ncbi:MAG TPA: anhydro-N-acetylmuramic acid kinase, partial [Phototrophicaceae bacterium]|nr:anhydro-N-acetylmuramic acid kinase [Phototrophicaceae bacterium]
ITRLNADVGEAFADAVLKLIEEAGLTPAQIDLIGSHGQTVWHDVRPDGTVYATLQIGEATIIAERTGITTISNFRSRDIAVGGQGAPLTAYADWLLLRHPTQWRAMQNIGGIGNVTFLPPLADITSEPLAFDTGPGNALIDSAVTSLTDGALTYDRDGLMAKGGQVQQAWLDELLKHPYYERRPPKTTGRELFSPALAQQLIAEGRRRGYSANDIVATLTALTAASIADAYRRFAPARIGEVIVAGGGAHNPAMMSFLTDELDSTPLFMSEQIDLSSDYKEGLVFALLAHETWHDRPDNLPSLTGAQARVVLGQITPGNNYLELVRKTLC